METDREVHDMETEVRDTHDSEPSAKLVFDPVMLAHLCCVVAQR